MYYNQLENKYIQPGQQFVLNNITYPASWFDKATKEDKDLLGLQEVTFTNSPANQEFYFVNEELNGAYKTYINTPRPLQDVRNNLWNKIKEYRDNIQEKGVLVDGLWFHNDMKSRSQWERMATRSASLSTTEPYLIDGIQVYWKTMTGDFVALTAGLIQNVVTAIEIQEATIFLISENKRIHINTLTVEELSTYDIRELFPSMFPEELNV